MANLLPWITRVWAGLGSLSNLMARYWTHHGTGKIFEEKHISGENSIFDFSSLVTAATWKLTLFHLYTKFQYRLILFTLTDHEKYFLSYGFMKGTWSVESHYPNPRSCYSFPGGRGGEGRGSGNHPLHLSPFVFPLTGTLLFSNGYDVQQTILLNRLDERSLFEFVASILLLNVNFRLDLYVLKLKKQNYKL